MNIIRNTAVTADGRMAEELSNCQISDNSVEYIRNNVWADGRMAEELFRIYSTELFRIYSTEAHTLFRIYSTEFCRIYTE